MMTRTSLHPRSKLPPQRDQDETAFSTILGELVRRVPGAYAAALVDRDGETVDYAAGSISPYDVKVTAAHWSIVLHQIDQTAFPKAALIIARADRASFMTRRMPDGYALVVLLGKRAGFRPAIRALSWAESALAKEAAWSLSPGAQVWVAVDVDVDDRQRPIRVKKGTFVEDVTVLGAMVGLRRPERGFRVRFQTGNELNLVREPGNFWYADAPIG